MDQKNFVERKLREYEEEGVSPLNSKLYSAHYPAPRGLGEDTINLLWEDHQVQGILQSEEYGRCCFLVRDAYKFLNGEGFLCEGWFDLYDLYQKWSTEHTTKLAEKLNEHQNTKKSQRENGESMAERELGWMSRELKSENAKNTNSQKWMCTVTGHVSNPGGLTRHQRYRGVDTKNRVRVDD